MPRRAILFLLLATTLALPAAVLAVSPHRAAVPTTAGKGCVQEATVTNANDDGAGSLRALIGGLCDGGTIGFAERFVIDLQSPIVIDRALSLDGSSQALPASETEDNLVQLIGGADHRIFEVTATGDLTLRQLRLSNSHTDGLGGAINSLGRLAVVECRFDGNSAGTLGGLGGGAIFTGADSSLLVEGSTFDNNDAVRGAAIFNNGQAELRNSTFSGHRGETNEGAIQNRGILLAIHITVANNGREGAGFGGLFAFNADTTLVNSLFADNVGNNCFFSGGTGVATGLLAQSGNCGAQFNGDPQLLPLSGNRGVTATHALAADSIAIDAADAEFCLATDQRGAARPQGAGCDLGAFEVLGPELFEDGFESAR